MRKIDYYIPSAHSEEMICMEHKPECGAWGYQRGDRLLEACLLCLLQEQNSYGYSLLEDLKQCGFAHENLHASVVYRNLRRLEAQGWASSYWVKSDQGPKKRLYAITRRGAKALEEWMGLLRTRKRQIAAVIERYEGR